MPFSFSLSLCFDRMHEYRSCVLPNPNNNSHKWKSPVGQKKKDVSHPKTINVCSFVFHHAKKGREKENLYLLKIK